MELKLHESDLQQGDGDGHVLPSLVVHPPALLRAVALPPLDRGQHPLRLPVGKPLRTRVGLELRVQAPLSCRKYPSNLPKYRKISVEIP